MGTGKTCSALGAVERLIRDESSPYNRVLVLGSGDTRQLSINSSICPSRRRVVATRLYENERSLGAIAEHLARSLTPAAKASSKLFRRKRMSSRTSAAKARGIHVPYQPTQGLTTLVFLRRHHPHGREEEVILGKVAAISRRYFTRLDVFGCVENKLSTFRRWRGLMINRCAVAGLFSA